MYTLSAEKRYCKRLLAAVESFKYINSGEYPTGVGYEHWSDKTALVADKVRHYSHYWELDNKSHREHGPAIVSYTNGLIESELWSLNGSTHRIDGPAFTRYYEGGNDKEWYVMGKKITKKDFTSWEMICQYQAAELFTPSEIIHMRFR